MATSIQISETLHKELGERKFYDNETYEEIIWDLIEDTQELSDETKKELEESRAEIKKGKSHTMAEVKKELGI
jgi:RNA polymerase-interacting CarD/CdnL/TRCF family regulator